MRLLLSFLVVAGLFAQDAGLILRTYVSYNTLLASSTLSAEKKAEVTALGKQAMGARTAGQYGEALKLLHKGTALMRGLEWTPAVSKAASYDLSVDHAVWEPGKTIVLRLKPMYEADPGAPEPLSGTIALQPLPEGEPVKLGRIKGDSASITVPRVPAGAYRMELMLQPIPEPKKLTVVVAPGLPDRAAALRGRVAGLKAANGPALWTLRYLADLVERADHSEISAQLPFDRELRLGEEIAAALEKGSDAFAGRTGDLHLAYLSKIDDTLQPYRLYVPGGYKADKPAPLIIALHGMGGDENSLFDRYNDPQLQIQAEKRGFLVAAPKGRDSASMYRGPAEQDVMDVLAQVRALYNVDAKRIYLMGHSMGGYGTWSVAVNHPDVFAALAPFAGGGNPADLEKIRNVPEIVFHGDADKTVNVESSRRMVEAAKKLGIEVKYIEIPGGGHGDIVMPFIPRMFQFFSEHSR